jgi:protocatechuate 3,4-dioxygenase beta subunit
MEIDNDDALIGRILTRREAIRLAALTGTGLAMASLFDRFAMAAPTTQPRLPMIASPVMTEGPFFVDNKMNRMDVVSVTSRASVVEGVPLLLSFAAYKLNGEEYATLKDLQIDIWQCDSIGVYSNQATPEKPADDPHFLRGFQTTDADGVATFKTIVPGWYPGRAPHIHFKVRQFDAEKNVTSDFASQLYFHPADTDRIYAKPPYLAHGPANMPNSRDSIYNAKLSDGTIAGSYMLLNLIEHPEIKGYKSHFDIILTDGNMVAPRRRV